MKNRKLSNNKGFTLVELLIVITISMIIMGILGYSYSVVHNANVTRAAHRLESMLKTARARTMAQGSAAGAMTIEKRADGNFYAVIGTGAGQTDELICNGGVKIYGTNDYTATSGVEISPSAKVTFRTSGALRTSGSSTDYKKFILTKGTRVMEVIIYEETGAVDVNMQ